MATIAPPESRQRRRQPVGMALLAVVAMVSGLLYLLDTGLPGLLHASLKGLPILCMAVWVLTGRRGRETNIVALGLFLSAAGDYLLHGSTFILGMGAFLMAHICYTAAFLSASTRPRPLFAVPFAVWGVTAYVLVFPRLGGLAIPVALYVTVISLMMWRAAAQAPEKRGGWIGLAGALLFGASDTMIALGSWSGIGPFPGWLIMATYWGGQVLIAAWGRRSLNVGR